MSTIEFPEEPGFYWYRISKEDAWEPIELIQALDGEAEFFAYTIGEEEEFNLAHPGIEFREMQLPADEPSEAENVS